MQARRITVSVLGAAVASAALLWWNRPAKTHLAPVVVAAADQARAGHLASAVVDLKAHLQTDPNDGNAHLVLARIQQAQQRPSEACDSYQKALAELSETFEDLSEMALACRQSGLVARSDPMRKLLAEHKASWPEKRPLVALARLQMLSFDIPNAPPGLRGELLGQLAQTRNILPTPNNSLSRATHVEALWLLDRIEEAQALMVEAVNKGPTNWETLTLGLALAFTQFRQGEASAARTNLDQWVRQEARWTGAHFGMLKPLREMVSVTQQIRWDMPISDRPVHDEARRQRALENGIREEMSDRPLRASLKEVSEAIDQGQIEETIAAAQQTREILARDQGCNMENLVIRPHMVALMWEVEGQMHRKNDQRQAAEDAFAQALDLFPADPELKALAQTP